VPKTVLTDVSLRSFRAPAQGTIDYWDERLPAFGCRVSQGGTKTFILKLHNSRRAIGRYPTISLAAARVEAKRLLAEKTLGKVRPQSITFPQALKLFLEEKAKSRRPNTVADLTDRLNRHFPFKGQLADITHQDIGRRLRAIKTNSEHDHALAVAKTFFTWAHNRRYIDDNPVRGLSPHGHTARARVLSDAELKCIWEGAVSQGTFGVIVRLLILTGQRRGEIAALRSEYCDLNAEHNVVAGRGQCTITLPGELTKNHRSHTFPIGPLAVSVLRSLAPNSDTPLLFPARGQADTCFNGWSKSKVQLDKLSGVDGWTLHDLRRTVATRMAEMGTPPHVVERFLNHVSGTMSPLARVYNRATFQKEMRDAVDLWEAHLTKLLAS
jgi:integrase